MLHEHKALSYIINTLVGLMVVAFGFTVATYGVAYIGVVSGHYAHIDVIAKAGESTGLNEWFVGVLTIVAIAAAIGITLGMNRLGRNIIESIRCR